MIELMTKVRAIMISQVIEKSPKELVPQFDHVGIVFSIYIGRWRPFCSRDNFHVGYYVMLKIELKWKNWLL